MLDNGGYSTVSLVLWRQQVGGRYLGLRVPLFLRCTWCLDKACANDPATLRLVEVNVWRDSDRSFVEPAGLLKPLQVRVVVENSFSENIPKNGCRQSEALVWAVRCAGLELGSVRGPGWLLWLPGGRTSRFPTISMRHRKHSCGAKGARDND